MLSLFLVGLTLHNPNTLTVEGPEIRIKPVGTRRAAPEGDRCWPNR